MAERAGGVDRPAASRRRWARVAGVGCLVIIATGISGEFVVRGSLVVPGDPDATAAAILADEGLYRLGIAAELVMLLADVLLAAALPGAGGPAAAGPPDLLHARVLVLLGPDRPSP